MKVSDGIFAYMANRENFRYQEKKNISSWWRKVEQIMVVVELGKEKQSKWTNGKQKMVRKLTEGNYLICVLEWKRRKKGRSWNWAFTWGIVKIDKKKQNRKREENIASKVTFHSFGQKTKIIIDVEKIYRLDNGKWAKWL